jgi:hypothetical protein
MLVIFARHCAPEIRKFLLKKIGLDLIFSLFKCLTIVRVLEFFVNEIKRKASDDCFKVIHADF